MSVIGERARFGDVFAVREFRALWLAYLLSIAGDQLALVALTVLVFDRTHSALLTAATYTVSFLPWLLGGLTLAGFADRLPRRLVMVACDLARSVLVGVMALPAVPLPALLALLFVVTLLDSPFRSARSAMMPDVLPGDRYVLGTAAMQTVNRTGRAVGFAVGGLVVAAIGTRPALATDAATFATSALLVWAGVHARPAANGHGSSGRTIAGIKQGIDLVFRDGRLRTLMLLGWLVPFYAVPESLAVPLAARFHGGATVAGLIFASGPFGGIIGSLAFSRLVEPPTRLRWMGPLAACTCAVLALFVLPLNLPVALLVIAAAGGLSAYQLAANAAFVTMVPNHHRGQAMGLANGGIQAGQGLWFLAAGLAADTAAPATVIAVSGALGTMAALALAVQWREQR